LCLSADDAVIGLGCPRQGGRPNNYDKKAGGFDNFHRFAPVHFIYGFF